jgi:hypothetical protein
MHPAPRHRSSTADPREGSIANESIQVGGFRPRRIAGRDRSPVIRLPPLREMDRRRSEFGRASRCIRRAPLRASSRPARRERRLEISFAWTRATLQWLRCLAFPACPSTARCAPADSLAHALLGLPPSTAAARDVRAASGAEPAGDGGAARTIRATAPRDAPGRMWAPRAALRAPPHASARVLMERIDVPSRRRRPTSRLGGGDRSRISEQKPDTASRRRKPTSVSAESLRSGREDEPVARNRSNHASPADFESSPNAFRSVRREVSTRPCRETPHH